MRSLFIRSNSFGASFKILNSFETPELSSLSEGKFLMDALSSPPLSEESLKLELDDLQKRLNKKLRFEASVRSIHSLLRDRYPSSSTSLRKQFYIVVSRVATVLKTRYTATGFWVAGLSLFEEAERLVSDASEKKHLKSCIAQAKDQLTEVDIQPTQSSQAYLFEGHLTVDREPPQPQWLVQQNLMSAFASIVDGESSSAHVENVLGETANLMQELINGLDSIIPEILEDGGPPRAPPASKEVVEKLPVVVFSEEMLKKLGAEVECCICKEDLVIGDKMQELPCKHTFHPPCLKPWLDEHNSCPICRHELPTDDQKYETWKEREKEAEEERKGAENAVRGGEYMYV